MPKRLTVPMVAKLLRHFEGNMASVALKFGVTRQAVFMFCKAHPELQDVLQECRETMKDTAESCLYGKVKEGEGWAVRFYLRNQARDRGYVERSELDHTGTLRATINVSAEDLTDDELAAIAAQHQQRVATDQPGTSGSGDTSPPSGPQPST